MRSKTVKNILLSRDENWAAQDSQGHLMVWASIYLHSKWSLALQRLNATVRIKLVIEQEALRLSGRTTQSTPHTGIVL